MEASDYLQNFIADKRARGVPWQHISAMTNTPMPSLRPYMDLEAGYAAAALRDAEREAEAKAKAAAERKERSKLERKAKLERKEKVKRALPEPTAEMRLIAAKIAYQYGISYDHLIGRIYPSKLGPARHHLMWALLAKNYSKLAIAKFMSNRDHSSIVYGARAHMCRISGKTVSEARKSTRSQAQNTAESVA